MARRKVVRRKGYAEIEHEEQIRRQKKSKRIEVVGALALWGMAVTTFYLCLAHAFGLF